MWGEGEQRWDAEPRAGMPSPVGLRRPRPFTVGGWGKFCVLTFRVTMDKSATQIVCPVR